ncbi:MAG: arylsulfatase A-like enzyme [Limisphaerales bacterium]|jgi:arylsulfatase A-like enzyme
MRRLLASQLWADGKRLLIIPCLAFGLLAVTGASKPNFILIMCDDLGWGDVGFNGGKHIRTPHLDKMAANSLRLTRFYAQAPVCSPTRASVVTGRHHDRTGIYTANNGHLRAGEFTLYEALAGEGYATGHFGKWHIGTLTKKVRESNRGAKKPQDFSPPWSHRVDSTFATEAKTPTFDPMWKPAKAGDSKSFDTASRKGWNQVSAGEKKVAYGTHYWTAEETMVDPKSPEFTGDDSKIIMNRALKFIEAEKDQPFLAVIWLHAPHLPVVASREDAASYDDGSTTGFEQNYYGCVTALDRQIGRLRAFLRDQDIAQNTFVAFCSDNGPEGGDSSPGKQGPFRGRKRSLYEGGVRVPGLIEWPAKIKAGSTAAAACTVDYFPTIMDIVGFQMPDERPLDGISLLPIINGSLKSRPRPLAFHIRGKAAWHDGDLKAVGTVKGDKWELYDLAADPKESHNLAAEKGAKLKSMVKAWTQWKASVDASDQGADY